MGSVLLALLLASLPARAAEADPALARQARDALKKYCYGCHGSTFKVPGLNVLDREILVAAPPAGKKRKQPYVVPGKPDDSLVWERLGVDDDMPPEGSPAPSDAEKDLIKRWIEAGAPAATPEKVRPFLSEKDILKAIHDDVERAPSADRPFRRYFTLAHLHNNRTVLDDDLRLARAAVAKLVNSLSRRPKIAVVRAVDEHATVLAIDLRDVGWDRRDLWRTLLRNEEAPSGTTFSGAREDERKGYPYGLTHTHVGDDELQGLARDVNRLTGCELPYIRADWFVATASRPPLYEVILDLPASARTLEQDLGVDVQANFRNDRLARAGFASSGVSRHNRVVERHEQRKPKGAYWKSYDFKSDEAAAELPRFPLGPAFDDNPFPRQAFEHAGGEIIFRLPNRLQGYLLVNHKDDRIEAGPIEIVSDSLQTSGTATIVNGLSCMACHKDGTIAGFTDTIRAGHALQGEAARKVERLYPEKPALDGLLAGDSAAFLAALEQACGAFLRGGADPKKPIDQFPEPIGAEARRYVKDLGLAEVAAELGMPDPQALKARIEADPALGRLGLRPLLQPGGRIKRAAWESLKFLNTPYQDAARELGLGTPYHEL